MIDLCHSYSNGWSFYYYCTTAGVSALTGWPINNNTYISRPFIFTDIRCNGSESKLIDCLHSSTIADRSPEDTVYVHCQSFPPPSISLSVSSPLHIRSPATLTCVAGINSTFVDEVDVQISWNMAHTPLYNSSQMFITPTVFEMQHSTYTSNLTIRAMEEAHDGIYTCTAVLVSPTFGILFSPPAVSAVYLNVGASSNLLFQLKLIGVGQCSQWLLRFSTPSEKVQQVSSSIITNILQQCNNTCGQLSTNHITDGAFHCYRQGAHEVTFRARLHSTLRTNASQLINHLLNWVESGATLSIGGVLLSVVRGCDLVIGSFSDPECGADMDEVITTVSTLPSTTETPLITTTEAVPSVTLFQLKLIGVGQCGQWLLQHSSLLDKLHQVLTTIVNSVLKECLNNCELTAEQITDGAFQCFTQDAHQVTFRAELYTTNNGDILLHMANWKQSGATITISGLRLNVDPTCELVIRSFSDPECRSDDGTVTTPTISEQTTQTSSTVSEPTTASLATATTKSVPDESEETTVELKTDSKSTLPSTEPLSSAREHTATVTIGSKNGNDNQHIDITAIIVGSGVVVVIFILAVVVTILAVACLVVRYRRSPQRSNNPPPLSIVSPFPPPLYSETTMDTKTDLECNKLDLSSHQEHPAPPDYNSSVLPDDPPLYWEPSVTN